MKEHGVSLATVSAAFGALSREGLIETHHGRGTFVATGPRRAPAAAKQAKLGIFLPRMTGNPAGVLKGVYDASQDMGVRLEFLVFSGERERRQRCAEVLDGTVAVDGCLVMHVEGYDDVIDTMRKARFPVVVMDTPRRYDRLDQILLDHERAAADAVSHLADHGHRRVAVITGPLGNTSEPNEWSRAKFRGFRASVAERGLARDRALCVHLPDLDAASAADATRALVGRAAFSALFVAAGSVATDVVDTLRASGKDIPRDVAVVSFNVTEYERMAVDEYAISGMDVPRVECGRAAVELLLKIVSREAPRAPRVAELAIQFVRRRSCGCA
jgi:DNA-binding LacI/PurR family transcriptional regulator